MTKYKIILERKTCIGAFSCVAIGGGEDIWQLNNSEGKIDMKLRGALKSPEIQEVIVEDEDLVKKAISSGEVCPTISIRVINLDSGENLVK